MELQQQKFILEKRPENEWNINQCYRYTKEDLVIAQISENLGEELRSYYIERGNAIFGNTKQSESDVAQVLDVKGIELLQNLECQFLLLTWKSQDEERLLFLSSTRRVRALEFLDYLIAEFGLVRGTAEYAMGQISSVILSIKISDMDVENVTEYYLHMIVSYFERCDWINAEEYGTVNREFILQMDRYYKKKIAWAYVKSTDIALQGEVLRIKSLENESGVLLTAADNKYIMIGCRGEVYDIDEQKFVNIYETTDESLDVLEQMLDFLPAVERISNGDYISLDDIAKLCYPKPGVGIYAKELECRTKIFLSDDSSEYFLGRPGDYMAVSMDDLTDIYIIQRDIFGQTYETS